VRVNILRDDAVRGGRGSKGRGSGEWWEEKGEWERISREMVSGERVSGEGWMGKDERGKGEWERRFSKQKYSISFTTKAPAALPQPTKEKSNTILKSPYLELRSSLLGEQSVWDGIIFQNNTVSSVLKTCSFINPFTSICSMSCGWECVWERGFESECWKLRVLK